MPFEPRNLTRTPLFTQFWTSDTAGMAHRGLDEVTPEGVHNLAKYAKEHALDGTKSAPGEQVIDEDEKAVIKAILEHNHYGTFFEQDALPLLFDEFGIDPGAVHAPALVTAPVDAGSVELPARVTIIPEHQFKTIKLEQVADIFAREYEYRRDFYEDDRATKTEKGKRVLGLLRDYAELMNSYGKTGTTRQVADALIKAFYATPFAGVYGATDFNGMGIGAAQSLVLGIDPNGFTSKFPDAYPTASTTYLSMNGQMEGAMEYMDKFRAALGKETGAAKFEAAPYLGYLIGEESGHTKHGSLNENRPFSTSGVNWGKVLFVGDEEVANVPFVGDEFPIDCVDAYNRAVPCFTSRGDRFEIRDADGKALNVEKIIERDADGKATGWNAVFTQDDGTEVAPSEVLGVILDAGGRVKGNGKGGGSYDMWWFGFCDRNTAQRLYKSQYGIPELDRDVIKVKAGSEIIEVPLSDAQKLVDCDIPDLVTDETFVGFRFNDEPQTVTLKDGSRFQGRVNSRVLEYGPGAKWVGQDILAIHDAPERPMLGTIQMEVDGSTKRLDVGQIRKVIQDPATGEVTVLFNDDSKDDVVGKLLTDVPWDRAVESNGKLVLEQKSDNFPVRGEMSFHMPDGSTKWVAASDIYEIAGELEDEMRITEYMAWIEDSSGLFATDNSQGTVVSNGMRWVNKFEMDERSGEDYPEWANNRILRGVSGELERVDGDKMVFVRARYGHNKDADIKSTQFAGWVQIQEGRIINEGFVSGEPDFGWGAHGKLNWKARSSFNDLVEPEMRLQLLINGCTDEAKLQALADAGNLPANWRSYKVPQD